MHPTSRWAAWYGMSDPAVRADGVLDARPEQFLALADSCSAAAQRVLAGCSIAGSALAPLRSGWSAPTPEVRLEALIGTARVAAADIQATAAASRRFADAARRAQLQIGAAYGQADSEIAWGHLQPAASQDIFGLTDLTVSESVRAQRMAVVMQLSAAVQLAQSRLQGAAGELLSGLGADPRDHVTALHREVSGTASSGPDPSAAADARNRAALAADLASGSDRRRQLALGVQLALSHAAKAHSGAVQLLSYDPSRPRGQGAAAIAIGDVSTADHVAVLVPGVGNSPADMSGALDSAAGLVQAAGQATPGDSVAGVVWLGYDVPLSWPHDFSPTLGSGLLDSALALDGTDALAGGAELAAFSSGLRSLLRPSAGITLIGHSYGSTVVSQAAMQLTGDAGIDNIVLLASPGAGYGPATAADYRAVPADHVYVLSLPHDPVTGPLTDGIPALLNPIGLLSRTTLGPGAGAGPFGPDPASAQFGAQVIDAPSGVPVVGLHLGPTPIGLVAGALGGLAADLKQHAMTNYLGGAALAPVAAVVTGKYSRVKTRKGR